MRRVLVLALLGCASGGSGGGKPTSTTVTPAAAPERVVLVDARGRVYRTTDDNVTALEQLAPGTPAQAVQALVGAYEELGITVNTVDPAAGRVASENFSPTSRVGGKPLTAYVDCGTDNFGRSRVGTYAVTMTTRSAVQPAGAGQVRVQTVMSASAKQRGVSADPIACQSTGALEMRLNTMFATRMAK